MLTLQVMCSGELQKVLFVVSALTTLCIRSDDIDAFADIYYVCVLSVIVVTMSIQSTTVRVLQDLLVILKHSRPTCWKILKKCFLDATYILMYVANHQSHDGVLPVSKRGQRRASSLQIYFVFNSSETL